MDLTDVATAERVEVELDAFVEKRAREARDAAKIKELWAEQELRHRERRREENREAWRAFHAHMHALHQGLAADHEAKALALLEGQPQRTPHVPGDTPCTPTRSRGEGGDR